MDQISLASDSAMWFFLKTLERLQQLGLIMLLQPQPIFWPYAKLQGLTNQGLKYNRILDDIIKWAQHVTFRGVGHNHIKCITFDFGRTEAGECQLPTIIYG